jgi:hypothetical protein
LERLLLEMLREAGFVDGALHGWTGYRTSSCTPGALVSARKAEMDGAGRSSGFGWVLVVVGLIIAGIGLIWVRAPNLPPLGRLPVDSVIERPNSRFYFPIVACIVISVVLSLIMWLIRVVSDEPEGTIGRIR